MTKEEIKEKFKSLYDYMSVSNEPKYMMLFGDVMKDMMCWMVDNKPELAEKMVDKLEAINWNQYLSKDEAMEIVKSMAPPAAWQFDQWKKAMEDLGLEYRREHVFNCYALWTTMCMVYSDDGKTIASLMGIDYSNAASNPEFIKAVHQFAMNKMLDVDGKFDLRHYFLG